MGSKVFGKVGRERPSLGIGRFCFGRGALLKQSGDGRVVVGNVSKMEDSWIREGRGMTTKAGTSPWREGGPDTVDYGSNI